MPTGHETAAEPDWGRRAGVNRCDLSSAVRSGIWSPKRARNSWRSAPTAKSWPPPQHLAGSCGSESKHTLWAVVGKIVVAPGRVGCRRGKELLTHIPARRVVGGDALGL